MTRGPRRPPGTPPLVAGMLAMLVVSLATAVVATPAPAQDSTHARVRRKPPPGRPAPRVSVPDTTPHIHITIDTTHVDSLALDTLRRLVIQDSARAVRTRDSAQSAAACRGRRITQIAIRPQPPYVAAPSGNPRLARLLRRLTELHATTRDAVIRRFLAVRVGEVCEDIRLAESERLLRAQPFIQSARLSAYADGPDGVRIDVFTVDELAAEIGIGVEGQAPLIDMLRLGNGNLLGRALRVSGEWAYATGYPDRWGGEIADYQVLGRPWVGAVTAIRDHVGGNVDASLSHPYFTLLQRLGWQVAGGSDHDYIVFRHPGEHAPALDLVRQYANAGALFRLGRPTRFDAPATPDGRPIRYSELALIGAAVSHEDDAIGRAPVRLTGTGAVVDTTAATAAAFAGRYASHDSRRINALFGLRAVRYLTVRGFDALLGEQDVPLGIQAGGVAGHSLPWLGPNQDPDVFVSGRVDMASGTTRWILRASAEAEARRDERTRDWDGLIASGRAAWYLKPTLSQTLIVSADGALGERVRVPFELLLGDARAGVRGYTGAEVGGASRAVGRFEYRHLVRMPWSVLRAAASWGLAGFLDAGRVWSGDAAFGTTSPIVAGAGVGLLVGIPRASRQLWRLDLAAPLVPQPHAGWELRVTFSSATRVWWTEPPDVLRSRERTVEPTLFSYP